MSSVVKTLGSVLLVVALPLVFESMGQGQGKTPPYLDSSLPVEARVEDLVGRMSLEEKVAQMLCVWPAYSIPAPFQGKQLMDAAGDFNPATAGALLKNGIGQVARPSEAKSPRKTVEFVNAIQKYLKENTRLGIPALMHEEGLHGQKAMGATSFPQAIGLAGTWDPALVERVFAATAAEIRARGGHQALTPVVDVALDPRWGRIEETYGEDPYLVGRLGVACVRGFQGSGPNIDPNHVIATLKHFAVHSQPLGGTNVAPHPYGERYIREVFLKPFKSAIEEAGARSVMPSYNEVDGVPSHVNRWLLRDVLRREWGFQGTVVSDYFAIAQLANFHHVAGDDQEAARKAVAAGVDIELPDPQAYSTLVRQVREGLVSEAELDVSVRRLVRQKFELGLFENPYVDADRAEVVANSPEHRALALEAARETLTLLKNEGGVLPFDRAALRRLAVIGPNADRCVLGGYSDDPGRCVTVLDGIRAKVGAQIEVLYAEGAGITKKGSDWGSDPVELTDPVEDGKKIEEALSLARQADAVLLVIGGNDATTREAYADNHLGDRDSLDLVGRQNEMALSILETGKPVAVLLINGRPLSIRDLADRAPAILEGWYLGQEGGTAVADAVFGDYNPGGKLPVTFPRSVGQVPAYYFQKPSGRRGYLFTSKEPLFPFGHGLSYTRFAYGDPQVSPRIIGPRGTATVAIAVTNQGKRAGDEVVQLYVRDQVSSVTRPVKELRGFQRISLEPGETKNVEFKLGFEDLAFWDADMNWSVEPGLFDLMVGGDSVDLRKTVLEVKLP